MKRILYILIITAFALHANAQLLYELSGRSCKQKSYILAINRYVKEGKQSKSDLVNEIERAAHYFEENYNKEIFSLL